jgi:hypothetical protein
MKPKPVPSKRFATPPREEEEEEESGSDEEEEGDGSVRGSSLPLLYFPFVAEGFRLT